MANKGWNTTEGGGSVASNARTTGRLSGAGNAMSFVQGSKIGHPSGGDSDPLDERSDLFEAPGQLSTTSCEH